MARLPLLLFRALPPVLALAMLGSCSDAVDDGVVDVAFLASREDMQADGLFLEPAGQALRAAQGQGLVRFDAGGNIVPGLAETWIVTDDGRSYIFRIAEYELPDGRRLTARLMRDTLDAARRRLGGSSLGLDLAKIADIRAMTGRVIEFRLTSPMPGFLQLLAQPELGLPGSGPMVAVESGGAGGGRAGGAAPLFQALPPQARGLPEQPDWGAGLHAVRAYAATPEEAASGFSAGRFDLVLGGTLTDLSLAETGALTRGTLRFDAAVGVFGLDIARPQGFLSAASNREAVALAIDREALPRAFNLDGWQATTRIVTPGLVGDTGTVAERWAELAIAQRRAIAAARVARWRAAQGAAPQLALFVPTGPGGNRLYAALAGDLGQIGVSVRRAATRGEADLALRDRVARYAEARWFLNQFACSVARRQCNPAADALVAAALTAPSPAAEAAFLAEAERVLMADNLFVPLGTPIRWSQARAALPGFAENPAAQHPLFPLSRAPI